MIVCAGDIEQFSFATPIGIGITQAAINTTELILKKRPKSLLFVGTAGSYGDANILDICYSNHAKNLEISFLESKSYTPIRLSTTTNLPENVSRETLQFVIVNSSHYISIEKSLCGAFLEHECQIENMEFYGFLSAASKFNIAAFGIFCITNFCDSNAHSDFILNHSKAKQILTKTINDNYEVFI